MWDILYKKQNRCGESKSKSYTSYTYVMKKQIRHMLSNIYPQKKQDEQKA